MFPRAIFDFLHPLFTPPFTPLLHRGCKKGCKKLAPQLCSAAFLAFFCAKSSPYVRLLWATFLNYELSTPTPFPVVRYESPELNRANVPGGELT